MKILVTIIDSKGFIHFKVGKSKTLVEKWLKTLKEGTEVRWNNNKEVLINQQYLIG